MTRRLLASTSVLGVVIALVVLMPSELSGDGGQQPAPNTEKYVPPRTVDGQPDLQGVWANNNATPLERPTALAGRALLTDAEVAALKAKAAELFSGDGDA